mgnify:CR=1 FL=1
MRLTVFCQGCPHNCKGCHNGHTHDFKGGYEIDIDEIVTKAKNNKILSGITFSGGEPMFFLLYNNYLVQSIVLFLSSIIRWLELPQTCF